MIVEAIFFGTLVSLITGGLILGSLAFNPRIWIGDAPQEMQEAASPLTQKEKRERTLWGIAIITSMLVALPLIAVLRSQIYSFTYFDAFLFIWIGGMIFNLFDLIIIDWLVVVYWHPAWAALPEVTHLSHLNNYRFHFTGFLKGCVFVTVWAGLSALIFLVI